MKYKVRVSELRYGEVEVEAASEREAKNEEQSHPRRVQLLRFGDNRHYR